MSPELKHPRRFLLSVQPRDAPDDDAAEGSTSHVNGRSDAGAGLEEGKRLSGAQRKKLAKEERKNKRGAVSGTMLVNGREVRDAEFKAVSGFVDQEDTLMSTLTVYETVLYSALLRLPREMSLAAKKFRTLETMNELGILGIRDMRIGDSSYRSISGGEKRRVSIACELVTSPSILFLDEPTSGEFV